jgi:transcriptional regulator with XRE-family HTH domain
MHWTYLGDLERGQQTPTLDMVNRVARGLGVTLAELFAPIDKPYRARFRKPRRDRERSRR